jgi:hypothetical protein
MFLLVYHVPVLCSLGVGLILLRVFGLVDWAGQLDLTPIAALLFLGPLVELGSGLIVGNAPRRWALSIPLFLLTYLLFMVVCTKAWVDRSLGRTYSWQKTPRTGHLSSHAPEVATA